MTGPSRSTVAPAGSGSTGCPRSCESYAARSSCALIEGRVREDELEPRAVRLRVGVHQLAPMRVRERLCDGEAEAAARGALRGVAAAREALEEPWDEVLADPRSSILDGETEVRITLRRRDADGRGAVAHRVRDQVGDDALEGVRVDASAELGLDLHGDRVLLIGGDARDDLVDQLAHDDLLAPELDRVRLEPRQVEQLVHERREMLGLLVQDPVEAGDLVELEPLAPSVQRHADPVDHGDRRPELVRGEGDEVALQVAEPRQALLLEPPLEEGGHEI